LIRLKKLTIIIGRPFERIGNLLFNELEKVAISLYIPLR
jgi:hypothetical protein